MNACSFMHRTLLGAVLSLTACGVSAATSCALAGSADARATSAGTPLELPVMLPDCGGVNVIGGSVKACVQDARGRLSCRTFGAGSILTASDLAGSGAESGMLGALIAMLKGKAASAPGVTRSADAGLPTGTVLLADGLQVDFRHAALANINEIVVRDAETDAPLAKLRRAGKKRIEASAFQPGRSYRWEFTSLVPVLAPSGTFSVADRELQRSAKAQRRLAADMRTDPVAHELTMAVWLYDNGLVYEADQALQRAGVMAGGAGG